MKIGAKSEQINYKIAPYGVAMCPLAKNFLYRVFQLIRSRIYRKVFFRTATNKNQRSAFKVYSMIKNSLSCLLLGHGLSLLTESVAELPENNRVKNMTTMCKSVRPVAKLKVRLSFNMKLVPKLQSATPLAPVQYVRAVPVTLGSQEKRI